MCEIGWREGLRQEVLSTGHTVMDDGIFGETSCVQHTQAITVRAQMRHQLAAGNAGHHHVGNQQVRLQPAAQAALQRFLAAARGHDFVAACLENLVRDRTHGSSSTSSTEARPRGSDSDRLRIGGVVARARGVASGR